MISRQCVSECFELGRCFLYDTSLGWYIPWALNPQNETSLGWYVLKVHKIEIFLALILKFVFFLYYLCQNIKILQKKFLIGPLLGEVRFFRVVLGLWGMKKNFELGPKFFFLFSIMDPKYDPILVFWKFNQLNAPGTTLCVDLGSKCQILFPLVWD